LQLDNKYYNRVYEKSIAKTYSIQISDFTKKLAKMLCTIHEWEHKLMRELSEHLCNPQFADYMTVFHKFGIGSKPAALLLSQIYLITQFQNVARFKRRLSMGKVEESSGDAKAPN